MSTFQAEPDTKPEPVTICSIAFKTAPSAVRSKRTEEINIRPAVKKGTVYNAHIDRKRSCQQNDQRESIKVHC